MRDEGRRLRAEVSPDQPAQLLDRVRLDDRPLFEGAVRRLHVLGRLFQAAAGVVVQPAVIGTAQADLLRDAEHHLDSTMQAAVADQTQIAAAVAVKNQVLTQQPHLLRRLLVQLGGRGDGHPVAAQQLAHRRAGANLGQSGVFSFGQHASSVVLSFREAKRRGIRATKVRISRLRLEMTVRAYFHFHSWMFQ